jgi:hypothetical protein
VHTLLEMFYQIEPGVLIAILGAEALIITLIPSSLLEKRPSFRIVAAVLCFALLFGEIRIVRHDREESNAKHELEMKDLLGRFAGLHEDLIGLQKNASPASHPSNPDTLKNRTLDLSSEILRFLLSREVPPGYGQGGYGEGPFGGMPADSTAYDKETQGDFFRVFEPRVEEIRQELKKRVIIDETLDREFSNPNPNNYSIRAIAERIGTLARSLPD